MSKVLEILTNIGFEWRIALANFVNFMIIFWLLNKFIFPSLKKALKNRKEVIEKGVADAQKAETALVMADEEKKKIINEANYRAGDIRSEAEQDRKKIVGDAKGEATKEAEKTIAEAHKKIEISQKESEKEIYEKAVNLVVDATEKILKEKIDEKKGQQIIAEMVK